MIGLDRAASLLKRMLGETAPFTPDEESALLLLGKDQAKSGRHAEAVQTYQSALLRRLTPVQRIEAFRGTGTSHFHLGNYPAAGKSFLNALQIRVDPFSQWLFKVVLDRLGSLPVDFPPELLFPLRSELADRSNPPLLEFTDVAASLGVNRRDGHGTCAWGDYDGDGDLDLLLGGRDTFIALYRNDGRRFVEVTDRASLSKVPSGYSLNFVDYDGDGNLDIYSQIGAADPGDMWENAFYRNDKENRRVKHAVPSRRVKHAAPPMNREWSGGWCRIAGRFLS